MRAPNRKPALSAAQFLLLNELVKQGAQHVVDYYKPGQALIRLKLARRDKHGRLEATPEGIRRIE